MLRIERLHGSFAQLFAQLDEAEVPIVIRIAAAARESRTAWLACAITRLGNGWLYPLLALSLIATRRIDNPPRFIFAASLNLLLALVIYPSLKHALARTRPCDYDVSLARFGAPLDHYSAPSGHTMTAVVFSITVLFAWPSGELLAVPLCAAMGWSRVALGHHYPTDVLLGGVVGAAIAIPVTSLLY